jgi:hypothetical protein
MAFGANAFGPEQSLASQVLRAPQIRAAREHRPRSGPVDVASAGIDAGYCHPCRCAMRRIGIAWLAAMVLVAACGQVAFGRERPATVIVREHFNARFGTPIEGFQVFLEVTRVRDKRVLTNRAFEVEHNPVRLPIPPGQYELTRYVREGGPIVCVPGSPCSEQLGIPTNSCSYRLRVGSGQVRSLLITANSRRCSIMRIRRRNELHQRRRRG